MEAVTDIQNYSSLQEGQSRKSNDFAFGATSPRLIMDQRKSKDKTNRLKNELDGIKGLSGSPALKKSAKGTPSLVTKLSPRLKRDRPQKRFNEEIKPEIV